MDKHSFLGDNMDNIDRGNDVFWEGLKQKLDDELTSEELKRVCKSHVMAIEA